LILTVGISVRL
jgi:hypothetical protein